MHPPDYLATQLFIVMDVIVKLSYEFEESIYKHPPFD